MAFLWIMFSVLSCANKILMWLKDVRVLIHTSYTFVVSRNIIYLHYQLIVYSARIWLDIIVISILNHYSAICTICRICHLRTVKPQIKLNICAVWSENHTVHLSENWPIWLIDGQCNYHIKLRGFASWSWDTLSAYVIKHLRWQCYGTRCHFGIHYLRWQVSCILRDNI